MSSEAVDIAAVFATLSPLDLAILRGAGRGLSSKQIGPLVQRSHHTVDDRLKVLKRKLAASDRAQAGRMLIAFEAGLDPLEDWGAQALGMALVAARGGHHELDGSVARGDGHRHAGTPLELRRLDPHALSPAGLVGVVVAAAAGLSVIFAGVMQALVMLQGLLEAA